MLATASHRAPFPLSSLLGSCQREIRMAQPKRGQIKSPSLCQREGTEGRECQYLSLSPKRSLPTVLDCRGLATLYSLPRRAACPFPGGEASKEKNMSLKRIFCNKGTLTNKFVGCLYNKKTPALYAGATYSFHFGGKRGIRTPGTVARSPHFECGPIDHSGIFPCIIGRADGSANSGANI